MAVFSAQYNNQLSYVNSSVLPYASPSSRVGGNGRGQQYNEETYMRFDPTSLSGQTVTACSLACVINSVSVPATSYTASIFNQLRKTYIQLSSTVRYDDFPVLDAWGSGAEGAAIQSATVPSAASGTVTFPTSASFVAMVQGWVDGSIDWRRGLILAAGNTGWYGYYHTFSSFTLTVTATAPVTSVVPQIMTNLFRIRAA